MLTMTVKQLREALAIGNPDGTESEYGKDQQDTELTFFFRENNETGEDGFVLERGVYFYFSEEPEEGCYGPLGDE